MSPSSTTSFDEWFATPNINFEDLQLPVGLSVAFQGAIASELAIAQRIVELKQKIDHEKAQFKQHMASLSVQEVRSFKIMLHDLKEDFLKKRAEAQGSCERMKSLADNVFKPTTKLKSARHLGVQASTPRWPRRRRRSLLCLNQRHLDKKRFKLSSPLQ